MLPRVFRKEVEVAIPGMPGIKSGCVPGLMAPKATFSSYLLAPAIGIVSINRGNIGEQKIQKKLQADFLLFHFKVEIIDILMYFGPRAHARICSADLPPETSKHQHPCFHQLVYW